MLKFHTNFDPVFHFLKDKYADKPFTIWHESFPKSIEELKENPYNFLILIEPNELFGLHSHAVNNQHLFTAILSWGPLIVKECSNGIRFTSSGRSLDYDFINSIKDKPKKFEVSFLSGVTNWIEGHKLRQSIYKIGNQINMPKKWYHVLNDFDHEKGVRPGYKEYSKDMSHIPAGVDPVGYGKRFLYEESMFNVVVESCWNDNWYNKIGDSFLTKCIPLYWGCPNISEFGYDERGIIRFKNEQELIQILNSLTPEVYEQMKPYIDYNYEVAKVDELEDNMISFFDEFIKLNNI